MHNTHTDLPSFFCIYSCAALCLYHSHRCWSISDRQEQGRKRQTLRNLLWKREESWTKGGREKKRERYVYTFISDGFPFWLLWNVNPFAHWDIGLWPFKESACRKKNPPTLAGLLQILVGLNSKADRHTETAGSITDCVTLAGTFNLLPEANMLVLDVLVDTFIVIF